MPFRPDAKSLPSRPDGTRVAFAGAHWGRFRAEPFASPVLDGRILQIKRSLIIRASWPDGKIICYEEISGTCWTVPAGGGKPAPLMTDHTWEPRARLVSRWASCLDFSRPACEGTVALWRIPDVRRRSKENHAGNRMGGSSQHRRLGKPGSRIIPSSTSPTVTPPLPPFGPGNVAFAPFGTRTS